MPAHPGACNVVDTGNANLNWNSSLLEILARAKGLAARGRRGRYAPSPTGPLHLGNLRTAMLAWLQARLAGGSFILRMEDLDQPRVKQGSATSILHDLRWLGLDWDEGPWSGGPFSPYCQSLRNPFYQAAFDLLHKKGHLFACFCSRKDISAATSAPHGHSGIYPGTCRSLNFLPSDRPLQQGRLPAWRYRADDRDIQFMDRVMGSHQQNLARDVGDFVVRRSDQLFAYQLAVVVDDAFMGITDILRGADLLDSSTRQIALFEALDLPVPNFWHVPLLNDDQGRRLSKRSGSQSLESLRDQGHDAAMVIGYLAASLGLVPHNTRISLDELRTHLELNPDIWWPKCTSGQKVAVN